MIRDMIQEQIQQAMKAVMTETKGNMVNCDYSEFNGSSGKKKSVKGSNGSKRILTLPEKTANWPGLPGKGGPNRSAGSPTSGKIGKFHVKKEGF